MSALFRFLVSYEILIYVILGLGAVFAFRSTFISWNEWRKSVYGLEKELAFQRVRVSGALLTILIMLGLTQFCLVSFVVPFLPAQTFLMTPTVDLLTTPLPSLQPLLSTDVTATPGTAQAPAGTTGCVPGKLIITSLQTGQDVSGSVDLIGTVDIPDFGYFKYEVAPQGSDLWATIAAGNQPVHDGKLGAWDTSELTPGDYQIRLVATDNQGNAMPPCIIPVHVQAP